MYFRTVCSVAGPDGTRMLTHFPFDYVNTVEDPYQIVDWMRQFEANTGFTKMMLLFGVGDHGGGPSLEMMSRIDRLAKLDIFPTVELALQGNTSICRMRKTSPIFRFGTTNFISNITRGHTPRRQT